MRKNIKEMTETELRTALKEDAEKVLPILRELVIEGIDTAPTSLLQNSDIMLILSGAIHALDEKFVEFHKANATTSKTDKKHYN